MECQATTGQENSEVSVPSVAHGLLVPTKKRQHYSHSVCNVHGMPKDGNGSRGVSLTICWLLDRNLGNCTEKM